MAELSYTDFVRETARFLGFAEDSSNRTSAETSVIDYIVQAGVRRFLLADGEHIWSFLRPAATLSLTADDYDVDLPSDFGGMADGAFHFTTDTQGWQSIPVMPIAEIRRRRAAMDDSGQPQIAGIEPVTLDQTVGQRWQALFWPVPDGSYTLTYRYNVLSNAIDATNLYTYGGAIHSETVKEAILSIAEQREDDESGMHSKLYYETLLPQSIRRDQTSQQPAYFGYNSDPSGQKGVYRHRYNHSITVNGVTPE